MTSELKERLAAGITAETAWRGIAELAAWRDRFLVDLLALRAGQKVPRDNELPYQNRDPRVLVPTKAELLARAVAPGGKVYAQNSEAAFARVKDRLDARLKTPAAANIVSLVRPFEDPAPPGMHDFDLMTFFYAYHDITYLGVDRAKINKALYDALQPGAELVVGDYSARPGAGTSVVQTLHRSDEALVTSEIEVAGFKLIDHGDFLHVPGMPETPTRIPRPNQSIATC